MVVGQNNLIIIGDFNYPNIDRADGTAHSSKTQHFLNVLRDNLFYVPVVVDAPTRNKDRSTNHKQSSADSECGRDDLGNSDHRAITFTERHRKSRHEGRTNTLKYKRAKFIKLPFHTS